MASITSLKASDGTGNASVATVQSVRSSGATTLVVDTVQGINTKFHATMGTPHTFVDPVTSETITVISEATAVDFAGHVDGSNLEIDTIAPGFTDAGSAVNDIVIIKPTTQWADQVATVLNVAHDDDGTLKAGAVDNAAVLASNVVETSKIPDGAVTPAKLSTAPSGFGMQEIARTTLSTAGDTITVNSIPVRDHIKILIGYIASGGTADTSFRINNLSSAIYRMTYNASPAISTGTDTGAVTSLPVESGVVASGVKGYCVIDMWNASGGRRIGNMVTVSDTTSVLAWLRGSFIIDTSSQMTRFDLINAGTGDFGVGSEVIVLGAN